MAKESETNRVKRKGAGVLEWPHGAPSPFPKRLPDGRFIVDEKCRCGAKRSEHADTVAYGHGACPPASCPKYTFDDFVFARKVQQQRLAAEAANPGTT